ncbi:hypothetical protein A3731_18010 [Roseovarius sp. HI0049]|nr:hypothetical protein A3731_18010 [Roseovarius sp. HI0049]
MTLLPVLLWLGCVAGVLILGILYGCRIDEAGAYPCDFHGRDVGDTAAMMGVLAAWGPLIFGPFVLASGAAWGLFALIRHLRLRAKRG